jgi:hypothetical protein
MKFIPATYEWEQGDVIAAVGYDAVWIRTNNGWAATNGHMIDDAGATRIIVGEVARYMGNRKEKK